MNMTILPFLFFILTSCSSFKKIIEPPKVRLEKVRISKLSISNADLEVILEVQNPNNIDFDVKNIRYSLDINSKTVTTGTMKEKVIVKAKEKTEVSLPVQVLYKDLVSSALLLLQKDGMPYRVQGSVEIGPFTIPFDDKGSLKSSDL